MPVVISDNCFEFRKSVGVFVDFVLFAKFELMLGGFLNLFTNVSAAPFCISCLRVFFNPLVRESCLVVRLENCFKLLRQVCADCTMPDSNGYAFKGVGINRPLNVFRNA